MWLEIAQFWLVLGPPFGQTGQNRSTKFDRSKARGIFGFYLFLRFPRFLLFLLPHLTRQIRYFFLSNCCCWGFQSQHDLPYKSIKTVAAANSIAAFEVAFAARELRHDFAITWSSGTHGGQRCKDTNVRIREIHTVKCRGALSTLFRVREAAAVTLNAFKNSIAEDISDFGLSFSPPSESQIIKRLPSKWFISEALSNRKQNTRNAYK